MYSAEMAKHANGAAQYLVVQEEKNAKTHRRELLLNALKCQNGLG